VGIALFMSTVDGTIVATGLPTIRTALHTRLNWVSWTIAAYQLGLAVSMPLAGRIADQLGHKRVFVWSAALFTLTSLLCGMSINIETLIALRVIQALGGGAFMPAASGIVASAFGEQRHRALGLFTSIFPLGTLVGPIVGGFIITDWTWRGLFWVVVPFGVVFTTLAIVYLPVSPAPGGHADIASALSFGVALFGVTLAFTELGNPHTRFLSGGVVLALLASVISAVTFVRRLFHVSQPFIPLVLLKGRAFLASNIINFIWGTCAVGISSLIPSYGQERYHLTPLASGTLLSARAICEILFATIASLLIHRTGFRVPLIIGISILSGGVVLLAVPATGVSSYVWLAGSSALTGIGIGLSAPAANNACIELAPNNVGAIIGIRGAARQSGGILAIVLATAAATRGTDESETLSHAFIIFGVILFLTIPLVLLVPNGKRRSSVAMEIPNETRPSKHSPEIPQ
jgi:EmrB/QacA subfamily drug resistance transporter